MDSELLKDNEARDQGGEGQRDRIAQHKVAVHHAKRRRRIQESN